MKSFLHTTTVLGTTYNFYVDDSGFLKAATIPYAQGHKNRMTSKKLPKEALPEDPAPFIKGLPVDALYGLHNPWKMQRVKQMLEECYPERIGLTVYLTLRGRGGWGEDIHKGYTTAEDRGNVYKFAKKLCVDYQSSKFGYRKDVPKKGAKGTYSWACDVGFHQQHMHNGFPVQDAEIIAYFDNNVDFAWETNPTWLNPFTIKEKQGWHFNTSSEADKTVWDTRFQHGLDCLINAICIRPNSGCPFNSLKTLGKGLHPLQDIFAHISRFVCKVGNIQHHFGKEGEPADNPYFTCPHCSPRTKFKEDQKEDFFDRKKKKWYRLSQRYSDTKTITYLYLLFYRVMTESNSGYINVIDRLGLGTRVRVSERHVFENFATEFQKKCSKIRGISGDKLKALDNAITNIFGSSNDDARKPPCEHKPMSVSIACSGATIVEVSVCSDGEMFYEVLKKKPVKLRPPYRKPKPRKPSYIKIGKIVGKNAKISLNKDGDVVLVYEQLNEPYLSASVGKLDKKIINWTTPHNYDQGLCPDVAVTDDGCIVEVHKSQSYNNLYYRIGTIQNKTINWQQSKFYTSGRFPSIATIVQKDDVYVIEAHCHDNPNNYKAYSGVGTVVGNYIKWKRNRFWFDSYDRLDGEEVVAAANSEGTVLFLHKDLSQKENFFYCRIGSFESNTLSINFKGDCSTIKVLGNKPSISFVNKEEIVLAYVAYGRIHYRMLKRNGSSFTISKMLHLWY